MLHTFILQYRGLLFITHVLVTHFNIKYNYFRTKFIIYNSKTTISCQHKLSKNKCNILERYGRVKIEIKQNYVPVFYRVNKVWVLVLVRDDSAIVI